MNRKKYEVTKHMIIAASHQLKLPYNSPYNRLHGHNYSVSVHIEGDELNENGILFDFKIIKDKIHGKLDHRNLNDIFDFHPTAENIAEWISNTLQDVLDKEWGDDPLRPMVTLVEVKESEWNAACYRRN